MVRCPICDSVQFVFVVSPRRTNCPYCAATWIQNDAEQTLVDRPVTVGSSA